MKKLAVILFFASWIIACQPSEPPASPITVPNGDFETWNAWPLPLEWKTNSSPLSTSPFDTYTVQQDSVAYHGKFAAKLIYNGIYPAKAENKFAVPTHPSYLEFFAKINLYAPDTVSVRVDVFMNDTIVDGGYWSCTTSLNNYTPVILPLTNQSAQADSVLITITGGKNPGPAEQKTEFRIDYMSMR